MQHHHHIICLFITISCEPKKTTWQHVITILLVTTTSTGPAIGDVEARYVDVLPEDSSAVAPGGRDSHQVRCVHFVNSTGADR
jgi:hypothetical protein